MRYESLLASRYIRAQKRQSVFTLLSIVVAVAVISVFFVLYGVLLGNLRASAYQNGPYHLLIREWPENKASALRSNQYVQSVNFEPKENGYLSAKIMLRKGIDDPNEWLKNMEIQHRVELSRTVSESDADEAWEQAHSLPPYEWNEMLMFVDGIGSDSIVVRLFLFALLFLFVLFFSIAIRLVVDTAFEISSKEREQHYGLLQSIGATPQQIVRIITREGLRLCVVAIPIGVALGVLLSFGMYRAILSAGLSDLLGSEAEGAYQPSFIVLPRMLLISAMVGVVWTFFSAYGVGLRVVRKTPMDAITARGKEVDPGRRSGLLRRELTLLGLLSSLLFGLPGRIAYRNARRQKKRFRITVLTLTVSVTLFAIFTALATAVENTMLALIRENAYEGSDFLVMPADGADLPDTLSLLENSGLFHEVRLIRTEMLEYPEGDTMSEQQLGFRLSVDFVNPSVYQAIFGAEPPVSYEALASSGSFVYIPFRIEAFADEYDNNKNAAAFYEKLSVGYQKVLSDAQAGEVTLNSYSIPEYDPWQSLADPDTEVPAIQRRPHAFPVCAVVSDLPQYDYYGGDLIGTLDTYLKLRNDLLSNEANEDRDFFIYLFVGQENGYSRAAYQKIDAFFRAHADQIDVWRDSYAEGLRTQNGIAALRAGVLFLNCIIALAALINLLNIISTGIANRRSELASLQCVGMTDGQLLRMSLIECLQYVLKAALASLLLCALIHVGFNRILVPKIIMGRYGELFEGFQRLLDLAKLDFAVIALRIVLASAFTFAAGSVASLAMLRAQGKQSLAERVRNAE
ncbi:MAG: ABC transporter permease [Oscillospiraceae bacterium]|nr:ABC transporter permease [Oscillospiraceae bacterium]